MNKLLMSIKRGFLLPIIAGLALSSTAPVAAYSYDYNALLKKIFALLAPLLRYQNTNRAAFKQRAQNPFNAPKAFKKDLQFNAPRMPTPTAPKPVAQPAPTPVVAQAIHQAKPAAQQHDAHHDEALMTCLDTLYTCVKDTHTCKQQFLNPDAAGSYREFKRKFDANLAALYVVSDMIAQKQSAGEQFKTLGHIVHELIQTQKLMCDVLNESYGSGMALGLSLAKIEKPTEAARAKVATLATHLHKALRGKAHTLKKLKTVTTEIHALLAPPKELGLGVMTLWGICNKRM